jgi:glycine dehydrogenase
MLEVVGQPSLEALVDAALPAGTRTQRPLGLPPAESEFRALARLEAMACKNQVFRSYLGMGYHDCVVPAVIQRNVLENPRWYTPYTPYQSEVAQGRLEGLLNFQTMIAELTGLEIANASLLDEATAAAEAMMMCHRVKGGEGRDTFIVAPGCHPQTIEVVRTRGQALGLRVVLAEPGDGASLGEVFGVLVQNPATDGVLRDLRPVVAQVHASGALVVVATDLLSLALLRPPGEDGADVAVGSAQRFGVPMGYGGPHAAFFATRDVFKRQVPGRLVGVSKDARGRPALRLSLGTREQHIRREKATSNICTAQALLANMAAFYGIFHGPEGLQRIARRVHRLAALLAAGLRRIGCRVEHAAFFDTLRVEVESRRAADVVRLAEAHGMNLRLLGERVIGVALDETVTESDVAELFRVFNDDRPPGFGTEALEAELAQHIPSELARRSAFMGQEVFRRYRSETELMRYLRRLESKDLSLCDSMIPLGSCTMKLNAAAEMQPLSWPRFARMHPFAPLKQTRGYQQLFEQLESWLCEITGFAGVSLQPNAGSQGEYAGLLVIRGYHASRGESQRRVCLIPTSAHGTNPASAVMAGLQVVPVACDVDGNVDVADLRAKAGQHASELACLMMTYPSTHGIFEPGVREICEIVHAHGGQVYLDGANLNALVGICRPAELGADVGHVNLHKTFCIPHGGGGPGMGPIGVAEHLVPFLPDHPGVNLGGEEPIGAVSAAPWGSASLLTIPWLYLAAMGGDGLREATRIAILNANYVAVRLAAKYRVLYRGPGGLVAHECIIDLRSFKRVTVEDVAKRLMDFGFHAPTVSWPVAGTLMIEPTESESKGELDRFCEAMLAIYEEITAVESGAMDAVNNPLRQAPHPADVVCATGWDRPYSREQAAYPAAWLREWKFWPPVGRVDNVFGDRNLVCSCAGMELYASPGQSRLGTG